MIFIMIFIRLKLNFLNEMPLLEQSLVEAQPIIKTKTIIKRDKSVVQFNSDKIKIAIKKAFISAITSKKENDIKDLDQVVSSLTDSVVKSLPLSSHQSITIDMVQDHVERTLMEQKYFATAKAYVIYRNEHDARRLANKPETKHHRDLVAQSVKYFKDIYGYIIYLRTYARWIPNLGRRETWIETVDRYMLSMRNKLGSKLTEDEYTKIRNMVLSHEIMPSMRLLQCAGEPVERENMCAYNCSFIAPTCLEDIRDIMYISMCGTGVGFSVEKQFVDQFPEVKMLKYDAKAETHTVEDSKEGWCDAFLLGLKTWYDGRDITFDFSKVRKSGERLKVMGGRASGPQPLKELLDFCRRIIHQPRNQNERLTSLHIHDIICKVGQIVVAGGVRRSALISLSDLSDTELRGCKSGAFWVTSPQRSLANNSAVYNTKPTDIQLITEWKSLIDSQSGERGIFNRSSLATQLPERRVKFLGDKIKTLGTNPCGEILLQSHQLCNLSTIVCRPHDTVETLKDKIKYAAIIGTYQSMLTDFKYVSPKFKANAEAERLLGVSITGQFDCKTVRDPQVLSQLKTLAIETNIEYSRKFSINASHAVTAVKPEGTVSEMVGCSSGIHPAFSQYYDRRVRFNSTDPLFHLLRDQGVEYYPEVGQTYSNANTFVVSFPKESAKGGVTYNNITAVEMVKYQMMVKKYYTEHNPSCTINVGDNEWIAVLNEIMTNWDLVGGLSFLPRNDIIYELAPISPVTTVEYQKKKKQFDSLNIDLSKLTYYEKTDEHVDVKKELACVGGQCMAH